MRKRDNKVPDENIRKTLDSAANGSFTMKVSVSMITYNHEKFIAKALDSILMQRTNFDYEIVVGEDCSTDNTRNILLGYQERFPDKLRLFLNEQNIGMHRNNEQTLESCKGEYVAILEGDDYWTSPDKLQKQVDFLDKHPECVICFHNVMEFYEDGSREPHPFHENLKKEVFTVEDLLAGNFIPTLSSMFRNGITKVPELFSLLPMGDWPFHIFTALHGKIGYINEVMAVHVHHREGVWFTMAQTQNWVESHKASIIVYDYLYAHLGAKYRPMIARLLHELCHRLAREYEKRGELANARKYAVMAFSRHFLMNKELSKQLVRLYAPMLYKSVKMLQKTAYSVIKKVTSGCSSS